MGNEPVTKNGERLVIPSYSPQTTDHRFRPKQGSNGTLPVCGSTGIKNKNKTCTVEFQVEIKLAGVGLVSLIANWINQIIEF